jgi:hypothetical protein
MNRSEMIGHILRRQILVAEGNLVTKAELQKHSASYLQEYKNWLDQQFAPTVQAEQSRIQQREHQMTAAAFIQNFTYKNRKLSQCQANHSALYDLGKGYSPEDPLTPDVLRRLLDGGVIPESRFVWEGIRTQQETQAQKHKHQVQKQAQGEQQVRKDFILFEQVCKQLAIRGLTNVAPGEANFAELQRKIASPMSATTITEFLLHGNHEFEWAKNDDELITDWQTQAAINERHKLAVEIAEDTTTDLEQRQQIITRYMTPVIALEELHKMHDGSELRRSIGNALSYESTEMMRQKVEQIRLRRQYRQLPKEELKAIVQSDREAKQAQQFDSTHRLPEHITRQVIIKADGKTLRKWISFYGQQALDARLNGVA